MNLRRFQLLALALLAAALLAGCATPARVDRMQVDPSLAQRTTAATSPLKGKVVVQDVTGGSETNPAWMSKVSSSEFQRALEASLRDAGLLSDNRQGGAYRLVASMEALDQPFIGVSLTVTARVKYWLVENASGKTVYEKTISTTYTAEFSAAFFYNDRLTIANEGAMRSNIARLIEELIAFKAPPL